MYPARSILPSVFTQGSSVTFFYSCFTSMRCTRSVETASVTLELISWIRARPVSQTIMLDTAPFQCKQRLKTSCVKACNVCCLGAPRYMAVSSQPYSNSSLSFEYYAQSRTRYIFWRSDISTTGKYLVFSWKFGHRHFRSTGPTSFSVPRREVLWGCVATLPS